jgi:hypothetical protein
MRYPVTVDDSEEGLTLSLASPGQRWKAFLPHVRFGASDVSLDGTRAYDVIARRWSRARFDAARVPVPGRRRNTFEN